jgi:hypothetical protein
MDEDLMIQSIVTDNRITAQFSDKYLPRYARHGELHVVGGILYVYADLESDEFNQGRWFPLTDKKEIRVFEQTEPSRIWNIPIDFHTDNIQIIVYDENDKIYKDDFTVDIDGMEMQIVFETLSSGKVYIVVNKAFDWMDKKLIVADRKFAVTIDEDGTDDYFLEIDTKYFEVLKTGNTILRKDVDIGGM